MPDRHSTETEVPANQCVFSAGELNSKRNLPQHFRDCFYPLNYKFYTYHVPTDLRYVDWTNSGGTAGRPISDLTRSATTTRNITTTFGISATAKPSPSAQSPAHKRCRRKLNSYRKYGENFVVSQVSKYGIFRTGLWYEWATTNRYQIPSNPTNRVDEPLPNFHERFYTASSQPFVEYEYHVTQRLTVMGGFKFSHFNQNLTQFQDNTKTVGCLGGVLTPNNNTGVCVGGTPSTNHSAGYNSYMPSADANFRLKSNWSIYGQYGTGTIVPPSGRSSMWPERMWRFCRSRHPCTPFRAAPYSR